jgi:phosphoribosylformimino-5-aminoimidazole carboxamide ribonucleotide (ProFAR) isomerase
MRCYSEEWASARALHVCDSANAAPQTTRAYAMMRSSCESADAVIGRGGGICSCLHVCDGANAATQTTHAYAMLRDYARAEARC